MDEAKRTRGHVLKMVKQKKGHLNRIIAVRSLATLYYHFSYFFFFFFFIYHSRCYEIHKQIASHVFNNKYRRGGKRKLTIQSTLAREMNNVNRAFFYCRTFSLSLSLSLSRGVNVHSKPYSTRFRRKRS